MSTIPEAETYRRALSTMLVAKALSPTYRKLLKAHYAASGHTLSTMELAAVMDWDTHNPVNYHYGTR